MITRMKKYDFVVHHLIYNDFLLRLREEGVVHIARISNKSDEYERLREKNILYQRIRKLIERCEELIGGTQECTPASHGLTVEYAMDIADAFDRQSKAVEAANAAISAARREEERMKVWGRYSAENIKAIQDYGYVFGYYTSPTRSYKPEWEELYNAYEIETHGGTTYFVTLTKEPVSNIEAEPFKMNPLSLDQLHQATQDAIAEAGIATQTLKTLAANEIENLRQLVRLIRNDINLEKVRANTEMAADNSLMVIEGFCPNEKTDSLERMLSSTSDIYYEASDPEDNDNVPIKLHNNRFTRAFEPLTGMYGMPDYQEFDPTPILAPFFLLFFAMCMGDSGYGLALILFGLGIKYNKIRISMFEGLGSIITYLGIGTTIIGFFLGVGFGVDLSQETWIPAKLRGMMIVGEMYGYNIQMLLAIVIGVFHICLAIAMKAIGYTKRYGFTQTISTWGWLLLIVGLIITSCVMLCGLVSPEAAQWCMIAIGAISSLGIFIFNDPKRNVLINIGAGLWDTYGMVTGLLGDVLSYIRLFALGLAGGMLGGAFNNLASMVLGDSSNPLLFIPFVLILLFGHTLNLVMSALGAFVHPLRLTFVEYFKNSGYSGHGEKYEPFAEEW